MIPKNLLSTVCLILQVASAVFTVPSQETKEAGLVGDGRITSGPEGLVSTGQSGWEHTEYRADIDPANPKRMMVCSMRFSPEQNQLTSGVYATTDGGKTWRLSYNDDSIRFEGVWDPACSYGANSQAYFVTLFPKPIGSNAGYSIPYQVWGSSELRLMNLYSSIDGDRGWVRTGKLSAIDREDLIVDRTNSPYRGRLYIYGNTGGPRSTAWIVYSKDGGLTWSRSAQAQVQDSSLQQEGRGTILPDGTVLLPYLERSKVENGTQSTYVSVWSSRNGGENLGLPIRVSKASLGCGGLMAMASDHLSEPFGGRAYIAWGEKTLATCSVMLSHSDDKGSSWSSPIRVSGHVPAGATPMGLMPQLAINNAGAVGLAWYEPIDSPSGRGYWLRFSASLDGGESWIPGIKVSSHPFRERERDLLTQTFVRDSDDVLEDKGSRALQVQTKIGPRTYLDGWPGDYAVGLIAAVDKFRAFWIDNRTGRGEIYTVPITVIGKVGRPGGDALKGLENVTTALQLQVTSSVWNPVARTLSLKYQFQNTSKNTIEGPLVIRFLGVDSELGTPKLVLNKKIGSPTQFLIDDSDLIPPKGLRPGQTTDTRGVVLRYDKVNKLSGKSNIVASMNVIVYGRRGLSKIVDRTGPSLGTKNSVTNRLPVGTGHRNRSVFSSGP